MTECYRCGQEGHTRSQCPGDVPLPPPARPSRPPAIPPRIVRDPAIARTWAQVIRDTLGYPPSKENRDSPTSRPD